MNLEHLQGLNPPQLEAVQHIEGPLLVLAGAGSGKTKVITHRIAHLVAIRAARADQILGVTFTNKAAGEMKERVIRLLGPAGRWVWLSTFHSFCARLLRRHADLLGFTKAFTIYDEADSLALIKRIIKELGLPENQPSPGAAQNAISRAKDNLVESKAYFESADDYIKHNTGRIYDRYQRQLVKNNAMDFDDLLFSTVRLFENFADVLHEYHEKYPYLLVDEYQDTNYSQYRLVKQLAGERKNICVVGDDDQSIYTWRGADIRNILDFEADFPGCKVIKLEQNYRSTKNVLEAAHEVIKHNKKRKPKKLFTEKDSGDQITLMLCGDDRDEAEAVVTKIKYGVSNGLSPSDHAVLYRTHSQSRALEDALRDAGIPYVIIGGTRFYERKEVKDVVAYLRLAVNPADTESLLRIINVPKRKVGAQSVARLTELAAKRDVPLFEILADPESAGLKGQAAEELRKLHSIISGLASELGEFDPVTVVARLIEQIGYLKMLEAEKTPEADVRADNVREMVGAVDSYVERVSEEGDAEPTLQGFLEEVALINEIDTWDQSQEAAVLMTFHAAKGLEFDRVFLTGMEEGLFPLMRDLPSEDEMEEERRLCYVGITRAKSKLHLSMAGFRRRFDGLNTTMPSSFLKDIPERLLEVERFNYYDDRWAGRLPARMSANHAMNRREGVRRNYQDSAASQSELLDGILHEGVVVSHSKFGVGQIVEKEGQGEDMILTIKFGNDVKRIMPKYARLEVLER